MPDPHPDAYQRYREGVLTRHVLCSGRYLESLWLREFGLEDPPEYRRHERIAEIPEIVGDWGDERDFYVVEARSDDGPCLFASSDRLYLVWSGRGARHRLQWTSSTDGIDWDPKSTIDGQRSEHVPGFVHFKGRWYIAWTGTDSHHHLNVMSTTNGTDWGGKHTFRSNPQAHSNDGPRLVVVNSVMYLVWAGRGSNRRLQYTWSDDGTTWNPKTIIPNERSDHTPGFAWFKGKVYIAWTGTDDEHRLNVMASDDGGATWSGKRTFKTDPHRARSDDGPWLLATSDHLYLGWSGRGERKQLQWMSTPDGITWQPKAIIGKESARSPSFAYFKNNFYVAWRGEDDDHHLSTMRGHILQESHGRRYVPWTSQRREVYGGGDNPLLRGGILMSTLAIEYILKNTPSSLQFASLMFEYWERCEVRDANAQPLGFFLRCRNQQFVDELEQNASGDEIVGMVMGLYYLYLATETRHPTIAARVRALTNRLGANLKASGYAIVTPDAPTLSTNRVHIQRGAFGLVYFQWALQQAFRRITGTGYVPDSANYHTSSRRLWTIYQAEKRRMEAEDKRKDEGTVNELLGTMYVWSLQEHHPDDLDGSWRKEFEHRHNVDFIHGLALAVGAVAFGNMGAAAIELLWQAINIGADAWANKSPLSIYKTVINAYKKAVYFAPGDFAWFNLALVEHTLHYALNDRNGETEGVAKEARSMIEAMLGDRLVNHPDDDFYAAVIAKGLIAKHVDVGFMDRVNEAIAAREQLWEDLPLAETPQVRSGDWAAPVRWHNSAALGQATARMGEDFVWEHKEGARVFTIGSVRPTHSGMSSELFQRVVGPDRDAVYEAGGLDYLFPRALMARWLGSDLKFTEKFLSPLYALTGLPMTKNGHYLRAGCGQREDDLLLLGTIQH